MESAITGSFSGSIRESDIEPLLSVPNLRPARNPPVSQINIERKLRLRRKEVQVQILRPVE